MGVHAPRGSGEPKYKSVLAKLQDFHGSSRDMMKWERWVEHFDLHCEVANIGYSLYVKLLGEHLQGSAYEIYRGILRLEPDIFWPELQAKLKGHFQAEKNPTLQLAEYNCAAWGREENKTLNEFVTRLQGYMHVGLGDEANAKTKEMLIRVKFWESLPLRWRTQIENSSPGAPLSEIVKLAIKIQEKEKANKEIHKITDVMKRAFKDMPRGQDFAPARGQVRFGTDWNFCEREKPNFDKIQNTGQAAGRPYYGNGGGSAQRGNRINTGFNNNARRPFNNNNYGQRNAVPQHRQDTRRATFTPTQRLQGGNLPVRANFGNASANRGVGQGRRSVVNRPAYRAPARGATQAAANHHPANYATEYRQSVQDPPRVSSGSKPWERYLQTTVCGVAAIRANTASQSGQARKCPVWTVNVKAGNKAVNAIFDTGSTISIISLEQFTKYADDIGVKEAARRVKKVTETHRALSGHPQPFLGLIDVIITLGSDIGVVPCYILKETPTPLLLGDSFAEVFGVRCTVGIKTKHEWSVGPSGRTTRGAAIFNRSMGEGMMTVCHVAKDTKVMAGCRTAVNPTLQLAEYNCAAWGREENKTLNEFVTRLQGYMHVGLGDEANAKTKEMLIRVKFWESLPLRWRTQIENSSPGAPLSEIVKLAIKIQEKEKANKEIHKITDVMKRAFKDMPRGQDFAPARGQVRFGTDWNFCEREKPNFDKIQNTGQAAGRPYYGNGGGSAQRGNRINTGFNNNARRPFNNNNYGQRNAVPQHRQDTRRATFTPTQRLQGGNLPVRANFGNASANRGVGQGRRSVVNRPAYRAPARGATQAAANHHPANYATEYRQSVQDPPRVSSGSKPWERYLQTTVCGVAAIRANTASQSGQARKCPVWTVNVKAGNKAVNAIFDTGSTISIISLEQFTKYADDIGVKEAARRVKKVTETHRALSGHPQPFLGLIDVIITLGSDIGVVPCYILKETPTPLLLGDSFAEVFGVRCTVGIKTKHEWSVGPSGRTTRGAAIFNRSMGEGMMTVCHVAKDTKVMAGCRTAVTCQAPAESSGTECFVEGETDGVMLKDVFVPDSLVTVDSNGEFRVVVENYYPEARMLHQGQDLGVMEKVITQRRVGGGQTVGAVSQHRTQPERQRSTQAERKYPSRYVEFMDKVKLGRGRNEADARRVAALLAKYQDVFALNYGELGTVKGVKHDILMTADASVVRHKPKTDPTEDGQGIKGGN